MHQGRRARRHLPRLTGLALLQMALACVPRTRLHHMYEPGTPHGADPFVAVARTGHQPGISDLRQSSAWMLPSVQASDIAPPPRDGFALVGSSTIR